MVSDQHRQDAQPGAALDAAAQQSGAAPALDMAAMIPFPKLDDDASTAAVAVASSEMPGFAPLPFDESLIASSAVTSSAMSASTANGAMATSTGLPVNFFVDTAALAQHLAAVVADEKKLSDVRAGYCQEGHELADGF